MTDFNIENVIFVLNRKIQNVDFRATCVLILAGFFVAVSWSFNSTLVYDDIGFYRSFPQIVERIGWLKALIKIFCLDFPTEYRSYGLSRVIQFLIWSLGGGSALVYSLFISLFQVATALALYSLLVSLRFERLDALTFGLIWLISPFIGTSCFHHFSYLILPVSIAIVGVYFLFKATDDKKRFVAVLLGFLLALTGELHLIAIPAVIILMALASGNRLNIRASLFVTSSMLLTIVTHYLIWSNFAADNMNRHRFTLNLFHHDMDYWIYRILVAVRGVGFSIEEQIGDIAGQDYNWLIRVTVFSSFFVFLVLRAVIKVLPQSDIPRRSTLSLAWFLFIASCLYLLWFITVVVLTDAVPSSMPRRYGFIPLTVLLASITLAISSSFPQRKKNKVIVISVILGAIVTLFVRYQFYVLPETNKVDDRLSNMIVNELRKDPAKGVLIFHSSQDIFTPIVLDGATTGLTKRNVISAEVSQAKYGTYLPTYLNITKLFGAQFTCYVKKIRWDGKLTPECLPGSENPGVISASKAIIVANLGFDKYDPLGINVRVFANYIDFEPFFFSKKIVRGVHWVDLSNDVIAIDLGLTIPYIDTVFYDKNFNDSVKLPPKSWLINYGLISGEDGKYIHPNVAINSEYYRSNRYGSFDYGFKFTESDVIIDLDFWELWGRKSGDRIFDVQVSWNNGAWVSLGNIDPALINGDKPFSIRLSHQKTYSFKFRLSAAKGTKDVPFIQGIRITRIPPLGI